MRLHRRGFRAMGTDVEVLVSARDRHEALLDHAQRAIHELDARWSRFRRDSELSRLNAAPGCLAVLEPDTYSLIDRAIDAWYETDGRFDPSVLADVVAAGYDRSFDRLPDRPIVTAPISAGSRVGEIQRLPEARAIVLPHGVGLDLGGIAKGWAADVVAAGLVERGASGALVNIGGDLRAVGRPGIDEVWTVPIEDVSGRVVAVRSITDGGVATSTSQRRRWAGGHHLIDPATRRPVRTDTTQVTVVAPTATEAEIWAKAAFVSADPEAVLAARGLDRVVLHDARLQAVR